MNFNIRVAQEDDYRYVKEWLLEPNVLEGFPMCNEKEVEDSAKMWVFYHKFESCFIVEVDGEPAGSVLLNLTFFEKIKHQCLLSIIVGQKYRNLGLGKKLLEFIEIKAKEKFNIELLHLEVYENNPAKRLYERMGYQYYGEHKNFIKEDHNYKSKILMQKWLIQR